MVLVGAESTGKTTLTQLLADRFRTCWVPEYGREHWERKVQGLSMNDPPPSWSHDEFIHIATEQQRRENQLSRTANKVLLCDTNAFATGTWYERYYGKRAEPVDAIGRNDKVNLYLLTAPNVPFIQDGFRDGEKIRPWMHQRFHEQLTSGSIPWQLLEGDYAQRLEIASRAIESLVTHSPFDNANSPCVVISKRQQ